jgi:hypothetical protein
MDNRFFERPVLNSPYNYPGQYWELDGQGQPTQRIIETRRRAEFITPIPKPKSRRAKRIRKRWFLTRARAFQQKSNSTTLLQSLTICAIKSTSGENSQVPTGW